MQPKSPVIKRNVIALLTATVLAVGVAHAGGPPAAPPASESSKTAAGDARGSRGVSFTRDVNEAWSQARADGRRAGRAIGDGARSFGRATRDAAVKGWRAVRETFSAQGR
jgi:hypothetical protein